MLQSGSSSLAHYAYDAASRRTALTYGNTAHAAYGYAANNDLTSLTQSFVGSVVTLTYGYNKVHQRISNAPSDASYLYHPAAALSASYTPNAVNEYTVAAGATLSYDGNANLKTDGTYTYGYDTENRLLTVTATGHSFAYSYDPLSRRKQKTVDGVVTQYLLDGSQEIAEYDGTGTLLRRYVFGPGIDEPVATIAAAGTKSYNHQDALGSVIALSDGTTGAVGDKYTYSAYGESPSLAGNAFRYTGRRVDAETGLYYYRARYYSPRLGRFLQPDPIGYQGGLNLYAYVGGDPLNLTDPSGLIQEAVGNAVNALIQNLNPIGTANAQAALGLCAAGPAGCAAGASITAGQIILGGAAVAGAGAIILESQDQGLNGGSSTYRQRALADAGIDPGDAGDYQVHHIVAQSASVAGPAQVALSNAGIGIHDLDNLIALPTAVHQSLNNPAYYNAVNAAVVGGYQAAGTPGVSAALAQIKASLLAKGSFP